MLTDRARAETTKKPRTNPYLGRGRSYKNLGYPLLKAQRMVATKIESIVH